MNIKEVEKAILSLILTDENCLLKGMDKLTEESFVTKPSSKIFFIFFTLFMSGSNVSFLTATSKTHQTLTEYLEEVSETEASPRDFDDLLNILEDAKIKKECTLFADRILQDVTRTDTSGKKILDFVSDGSLELLSGKQSDITHISEVYEERFGGDKIDTPLEFVGYPSGLEGLDRIIDGFTFGSLNVIAGRTSTGKSQLSRQIAYFNAIRGVPSLTFSFEETKQQCLNKITALATGIDHFKVRHNYFDAEDKKAIKETGIGDLDLFFVDSSDTKPNMSALFAKAKKIMYLKKKKFILIVDYMQKLAKDSSELEISKVSGNLKLLAMRLDVPVLALCQLNRSIDSRDGKAPMLSDLRGSGSIEQDADKVLFIQTEGEDDPFAKEKNTLIWVLKNRNGATGLVKILNHRPIQKFTERKREVPKEDLLIGDSLID